MRSQWYVGYKGISAIAFKSQSTPTPSTGYNAVTGPFRTKRAAQFMAKFGRNNPHCQTVHDAERLANHYKDQYTGHWPDSLS